jgi:hypothetical protein
MMNFMFHNNSCFINGMMTLYQGAGYRIMGYYGHHKGYVS